MFKRTIIGISFITALFIATITIAEDAVVADPEHYTVEFENDKVRIIRIKYGPGEKSGHAYASSARSDYTDRKRVADDFA